MVGVGGPVVTEGSRPRDHESVGIGEGFYGLRNQLNWYLISKNWILSN